jgi:hypothetical protein
LTAKGLTKIFSEAGFKVRLTAKGIAKVDGIEAVEGDLGFVSITQNS